MKPSVVLIIIGAVIEVIATVAGMRSDAAVNGFSLLTWVGMVIALLGVYQFLVEREREQ